MKAFFQHTLTAIVLPFLFVSFSFAQDYKFEWVRTAGRANSVTIGSSLVIDSNKAVILTGTFFGTTDFDPGAAVFNLTSAGSQDCYIAEFDSSGNFKWAKSFGGFNDDNVTAIKKDNLGNLYLTGIFGGTADFDPGPAVQNLTTSVGTFIVKLDNNGNFIWARGVNSVYAEPLEVDADNNVIIAGNFGGTRDFDPGPGTVSVTATAAIDMFILKLDNAGNFVWVKQVRNAGASDHRQFALKCDVEKNILMGGEFSATLDFDPGTNVSNLTATPGSYDGFLLKLNAQGDFVWAKQFSGTQTERVYDIEADNSGNVYSTGEFSGTTDFDPGSGVTSLTAPGSFRSCFISKLDKNGNFLYAKNFQTGDSFGQSLAMDAGNNLYVAGGFHGSVDFDPGSGVYALSDGQLFTVKLDASGTFVWAAKYVATSPGAFENIYNDLAVDMFNNVYLTGAFSGTVDFDPNAAVTTRSVIGHSDMYIHRLSQCRSSLNVITATACSNYTLNSINYTTTGTYYQTRTNSIGCDSVIQLNLTIGNRFNQVNLTTCDAYFFNGTLITNSGTYKDTFQLTNGCDSILQLNLTITKIVNNVNLTSCGFYNWNGTVLTGTGVYRDTFRLTSGCDSIVVLNLTVNNKPTPDLGSDKVICKGDTIVLSPGVFNQYLWSNSTTAASIAVADTGTYWVRVTGSNNCIATDTIRINSSSQCACIITAETKLYPSPFEEFLIVKKNQTVCEVRMNLYNALGQLIIKDRVIKDGINNIPLKVLSTGVYFYQLFSDGKTLLSGKVLKQ